MCNPPLHPCLSTSDYSTPKIQIVPHRESSPHPLPNPQLPRGCCRRAVPCCNASARLQLGKSGPGIFAHSHSRPTRSPSAPQSPQRPGIVAQRRPVVRSPGPTWNHPALSAVCSTYNRGSSPDDSSGLVIRYNTACLASYLPNLSGSALEPPKSVNLDRHFSSRHHHHDARSSSTLLHCRPNPPQHRPPSSSPKENAPRLVSTFFLKTT